MTNPTDAKTVTIPFCPQEGFDFWNIEEVYKEHHAMDKTVAVARIIEKFLASSGKKQKAIMKGIELVDFLCDLEDSCNWIAEEDSMESDDIWRSETEHPRKRAARLLDLLTA